MNPDVRIEDVPAVVPLLPLGRVLLLPETTLPVVLINPGYAALVESLGEGGWCGFALAREDGAPQDVGCLGRIHRLEPHEEGVAVSFEGIVRFRLLRELPASTDGVPRGEIDCREFAGDLITEDEDLAGWDLDRIKTALLEIARQQTPGLDLASLEALPPRQIVKLMAQTLPFAPAEQQALLEAPTFRRLLELLFDLLAMNFLTTTPDLRQPRVN